LEGLNARTEYCKLKEAAADRAWWRTRFGRGNGPVVKTGNGMMTNYIDSSKTKVGFHEIFPCGKGFHRWKSLQNTDANGLLGALLKQSAFIGFIKFIIIDYNSTFTCQHYNSTFTCQHHKESWRNSSHFLRLCFLAFTSSAIWRFVVGGDVLDVPK
jgi:hypothetical protein